MVLFGCQSSLCVVVELGEELPSPADIQLAHSRLRSLCLGGGATALADRVEGRHGRQSTSSETKKGKTQNQTIYYCVPCQLLTVVFPRVRTFSNF